MSERGPDRYPMPRKHVISVHGNYQEKVRATGIPESELLQLQAVATLLDKPMELYSTAQGEFLHASAENRKHVYHYDHQKSELVLTLTPSKFPDTITLQGSTVRELYALLTDLLHGNGSDLYNNEYSMCQACGDDSTEGDVIGNGHQDDCPVILALNILREISK